MTERQAQFWEQTVNTHTWVDWTGKGELENFSICVFKVDSEKTDWEWSMNIIFHLSEQSITRYLKTREDALKEAEFQLDLFINARELLPTTVEECQEWVTAICDGNPEYMPHKEPKYPSAA